MEEDEEEEKAEEDDEIAAEIKGLEDKMATANAVEKRDLSNRISLLCDKQISLSKDPDGAMDMDDEAKEDMKASRAANEQARREDLPKLRRIIKDIEGLIPQDGEPDEAQSNMIADSRRKIDAIELETARVASPGKVKQITREALNKARSARDAAQGEVNSIDAAVLKDEELVEAATNRIRVARERRPAAAAELVTRTAEFDFAQSALDDLAPKKKAPAEVPKEAGQGSGGITAIDLVANFKAIVTAMNSDQELLNGCWGQENSSGRMALNGVFNQALRHTELLAARQSGAVQAASEANTIETYELPEVRGHQEITDAIYAEIDFDSALEAIDTEGGAAKKTPPDKAKLSAAVKKNLSGQVKKISEKQKGKPTAKPAGKGGVAKLF